MVVAYSRTQISRTTGWRCINTNIGVLIIVKIQTYKTHLSFNKPLTPTPGPTHRLKFETMPLPDLPTEVRRMILEALVKNGCELARFATVSREWQAVIEPHTFKRIKVTSSRIAELDDMTRRNRSHVEYLWLCVELERYDCDTCSPDGEDDEVPMFNSAADDLLIQTTIQSLLLALSTWDRNSSLTLDISVYSTSDPEHWFKYLTFEPDGDEMMLHDLIGQF
jgi:hypothetical protein